MSSTFFEKIQLSSATEELEARCREADILIAAIGKPEFVTSEFVGDGAIVIDVGINRIEDNNKKELVLSEM